MPLVSPGGTATAAAPPFSFRLLEHENEHAGDASRPDRDQLLSLLPAIHGWLWFAGLPMPPRALHHKLFLGREIFVTERMDMHLVWTTGRMLLKPIPRFLLEPDFWTKYLCCSTQNETG
ncbi:hypothetical protein EDB81DRAFT_848696 [Dactylonectria macrodidyma]|uniref:Uncharacterized protein n=1 Tax=Dactylonectria macrodidyma TaxID=307937 RepID=A0A9P9D6V6_9HYPO|nr:hypothetical protein EDB81DRAFT_848696 [Dactylonectria macrodidyma]